MRRSVIKPNRSTKRRRILFALVLFGLAVFFAPTLLAAFGLHNRVLRSIIPSEAGSLTAQSASLGWFSSTKLSGVQVRTHDGEALLDVPTLTLDRTLLNLITDRDNLGAVSVQNPTLHIVADTKGSNVEEFIVRFREAKTEPPTPISCDVDVQGGQVRLADGDVGSERAIEIEQLTCRMVEGDLNSVRAALADPGKGRLGVSLTTRADAAQQLDFSAENWPVDDATPWLRRLLDDARIAGRLTAKATTVWTSAAEGAAMESSGTATLAGLQAEAASLTGDRITLANLQIPWKIKQKANHLVVEQLAITSELGNVSAQGEVPLAANRAGDAEWQLAAIRTPLSATGTLDLARVAAMLPTTLRIRNGVNVTSGQAEFTAQSQPGEAAHRWSGSLTVRNLEARDRERAFRWERPMTVAAAIRHDNTWAIESLTCQSDFLQVAASGDRRQLDAQVDFDLARLATELGQFVELEDWQLAGRGSLRVAWKPSGDGPLRATATGSVNGLRFVDPGGRLFSEPSLQLSADVAFYLPAGDAPFLLERGSQVTISTDMDRLAVKLDTRSAWPPLTDGAPPWQGRVDAEGDLARWAQRLGPWVELEPWRVGGRAKFSTPFEVAGDAVVAKDLQAEIANLQAIGPGWRVNEPLVTLKTSGRFDVSQSSLIIGDTEFIGSSVTLAARNGRLNLSGDNALPQFSGEATFRAALERIDAWRIGADGRPVPIRPAGMVVGLIRVDGQPDGTAAEVTATVDDLTIYEYVAAPVGRQAGYRPGWQEPKLQLSAKVNYGRSADKWTIEQADVRSNALAAAIAGSVSDVTGNCEVNLRGSVDYDLANIGPVVAASLGLEMTMSGREQATFEVVGPLFAPDSGPTARMVATNSAVPEGSQAWSRRLRGRAAAGWESMGFFGLPIGPGRVEAEMRDGVLTFVPLNVSVGVDGRLSASATARLAPPPRELMVPAGPIITHVEITPEVSDKLLKYFIPALADAIETQGKFSLNTQGGRVPLDDPATVHSAGKLNVHSVRVRPGRLGREWILLAEQIEGVLKERRLPQLLPRAREDWLTIDEQVVDYRVENGRVYHENLVFHVGEVEVRSRGSVGFDQTLAIEIEVPIQDQWVAGRPWLAGFRGQTIKGTIRGTFGNIDRGTLLADLSSQLLENAAAGAIEEGLNRALDRLLRPRE